jgi:hypothetical protein
VGDAVGTTQLLSQAWTQTELTNCEVVGHIRIHVERSPPGHSNPEPLLAVGIATPPEIEDEE